MDEFKDLDSELERLKAEMAVQDDAVRNFNFPSPDDYWKRRIDEEKILWNKKVLARDEEKKALEAKLSQQQLQIDQYNQQLREFERRLEKEGMEWENRLKAKEADLLIEKNRLLNEEKVKSAETEVKRMQERLNDLNAKLISEKEENEAGLREQEEEFNKIRASYEEKISLGITQAELLKGRIAEIDSEIKRLTDDFAAKRAELEKKISDNEQEIKSLAEAKEKSEKEKAAALNDLAFIKIQSEEDRKKAVNAEKESQRNFVAGLKQHTGPLRGIAKLFAKEKTGRGASDILAKVVQNIENEIEAYSLVFDMPQTTQKHFKIAVLLAADEAAVIEKAAAKSQAEVVALPDKNVAAAVEGIKPRVAVVSVRHIKKASLIRAKFPSVPVLLFGDAKSRDGVRAAREGFDIVSPPYSTDDTWNIVSRAAYQSLAVPEFWGKIKPAGKLLKIAVTVFSALLICAGLYFGADYFIKKMADAEIRALAFSTPYSQPTSIAFDGQNIWSCDWMGQGIYKHKTDSSLSISKIFYFPGKHITALSWADGFIWSADSWDKKIYKHNVDAALTIVNSYPAPNGAPSGIAGDGKVLWTCDSAKAAIYRHRLDAQLSVEREYKSPGTSPSSLYFDGTNLWSSDSKTNKIYKHNLDDELSVLAVYITPDAEEKGYGLSGIAGSGSALWVCSEKAGKIYKYPTVLLKEIK